MLKKIIFIFIIMGLLTACSGPAIPSSTTPIPPAPTGLAQKTVTVDGVSITVVETPIAIPHPEPPEVLEIITLEATDEELAAFDKLVIDSTTSTKGGGKLAKLTCQQDFDCGEQATRLVKHLLADVTRQDRLNARNFWGTIKTLAEALEKGNVVIKGFARGTRAAIWLSWFDNIRKRNRELVFIFANRPNAPTLIPIGENVSQYGSLAVQATRLLQQVAEFDENTGYGMGKIFLTEAAASIVKNNLKMGWTIINARISGFLSNWIMGFGTCLRQKVLETKEYKDWEKAEQEKENNTNAANAAEFALFRSEEEATQAAATLVMLGITVWVVKFAIAGGTGQIWVLAIP